MFQKIFSSKKNIIIISIIAIILIIGVIIAAVILSNGISVSVSTSDMLQLADKYLKELNYEQAIIEFQKVLEIESKNVEAYMGLADAYIALGDTDKAIEVLKEGLEITGDSRIQDRLNELTKPKEAEQTTAQSTDTTVSETEAPVFGSMGSVTILEVEYDIATTTELDLSKSEITDNDLKQIARLTNLTKLSLAVNQITDITLLAGLTNLTVLYLYNNQITDITPLAGLTNLTGLFLGHNQIADITPLAGLTNLTVLDLTYNQITDITPLSGLTNLTRLDLSYNQITDITPLAGLTNLTDLWLFGNQIIEDQIEQLKVQLPNCEIK